MCVALFCVRAGYAVIIDRMAVSVGNRVITESDLIREIRVTAFLNGAEPDLSPAGKRATADRMVEQELIRTELETSRYPLPAAAEVAAGAREVQTGALPDAAEYQRAGCRRPASPNRTSKTSCCGSARCCGSSRSASAPRVQVSDQDIQDYFDKVVEPAAKAAHPGQPVALEDFRDRIEQTLTGQREDREMDTWLKEARRRTEIVYHAEAFQ